MTHCDDRATMTNKFLPRIDATNKIVIKRRSLSEVISFEVQFMRHLKSNNFLYFHIYISCLDLCKFNISRNTCLRWDSMQLEVAVAEERQGKERHERNIFWLAITAQEFLSAPVKLINSALLKGSYFIWCDNARKIFISFQYHFKGGSRRWRWYSELTAIVKITIMQPPPPFPLQIMNVSVNAQKWDGEISWRKVN